MGKTLSARRRVRRAQEQVRGGLPVLASQTFVPTTVDGEGTYQLNLAAFLVSRGWPANSLLVHVIPLFAAAVKAKYVEVYGGEPPRRNGGPFYEGDYPTWLLVNDCYEECIGAIAEQLAFGDAA